MSASEKLRALGDGLGEMAITEADQLWLDLQPTFVTLRNALPQIVALIEAAEEPANEIISDSLIPADDDWRPRFPKLVVAFEALDKALS